MLNNEIAKLKDKLNVALFYQDMKYEGGETLSRKQLDEIENNVANAVSKCERCKLKFERI